MPALRLTAGRTTPARKSPATTSRTPKRKPAARTASAPASTKRAPKRTAAPKQAAKPQVTESNGNGVPEGWTKAEWNQTTKAWNKALDAKLSAQEALSAAQVAVNELAMDAIANGVKMSVVSEALSLSRQRLYDLMEQYGVKTDRQKRNPHPNKGLTQEEIEAQRAKAARKPKPAAKRTAKKPAAKQTAKRSAKPAAANARRSPARKPAASNGRGTVRLARR